MRKTGTWLAGIVMGLTLGLGTSLLVNRPEVRADDKKPQWEYKVVPFGRDSDHSTKQIQKLADEGWEYVGLVTTSLLIPERLGAGGRLEAVRPASVAFKRPKK